MSVSFPRICNEIFVRVAAGLRVAVTQSQPHCPSPARISARAPVYSSSWYIQVLARHIRARISARIGCIRVNGTSESRFAALSAGNDLPDEFPSRERPRGNNYILVRAQRTISRHRRTQVLSAREKRDTQINREDAICETSAPARTAVVLFTKWTVIVSRRTLIRDSLNRTRKFDILLSLTKTRGRSNQYRGWKMGMAVAKNMLPVRIEWNYMIQRTNFPYDIFKLRA